MKSELSGFRRFLHWGPLATIGIIKCVTLTTLYMNSMWWPPNQTLGGFINQAVFLLLSSTSTFNYVMALLIGPGVLPKNWQPKVHNDIGQLQYCKVCEGYKAPRSHHCRKCGRCIKKMDHHCPWINNCVGYLNHAYFTTFLAFSILASFQAAIVLCCSFYRGVYRFWYLAHGQFHLATVRFTTISIIMCIFAMGLAIGVVIALSMLLYFQIKSIMRNKTGIEIWIVEKAMYRRSHNINDSEFVYPYDLGCWANMRQVYDTKCMAKGNGIEWAIVDGTDQYTLTREQLAQKSEKRARTLTFKCLRPFNGRFLPLFSQGWRVATSPPFTDEPRIRLQPGDIIKVTRFRKHWMFGERVVTPQAQEGETTKDQHKDPIRGWFPRRCAIELIEPKQNVCMADSDEERQLVENVTSPCAEKDTINSVLNGKTKQKHLNGSQKKNK